MGVMSVTKWPAVPPEPRHTAIELCCGMGGIGIGLAAAGYRVVKAYDSWPAAVAIYNHNSPESVASACDILSREGRATINEERRHLGDIDLLAAGAPCKGFSQIRQRPPRAAEPAQPSSVGDTRVRRHLLSEAGVDRKRTGLGAASRGQDHAWPARSPGETGAARAQIPGRVRAVRRGSLRHSLKRADGS